MSRQLLATTFIALAALTAPAAAEVWHEPAERSPYTAFGISVAATSASIALMYSSRQLDPGAGRNAMLGVGLASVLVTPALGHVYGRDKLLTTGTWIRAGGGALVAYGVLVNKYGPNPCREKPAGCGLLDDGAIPILLGAAAVSVGVIHDLVTVGYKTSRANDERRYAIAPTLVPTQAGVTAGLGVTGSF